MKTHLLIHRVGDEPNYALWWTFDPSEVGEARELCRLYGGEIRDTVREVEAMFYPSHEGPEELRVWLTFEYVDHDE